MTGPDPTAAAAIRAARPRFKKMSTLVADALRARIGRGEIGEGYFLPNEKVLQEQFGVSRPTLREAMRILEAEGLLITPRGGTRGAQIINPTHDQAARYAGLLLQVRGATIADILALRTLVEPEAARLAAGRHDPEAIRRRRELLAVAEASPSLRENAALMSAFDRALLTLSGNEALNLVGQMISHILAMHLHTIPDSLERMSEARIRTFRGFPAKMAAVLDAIEAADAEGAERLMKTSVAERQQFSRESFDERLMVVG